MWKVFFGLGMLVVVLLGAVVFVFTMGHASAGYELRLALRDAAGQPLAHQPVLVWRYDYPNQELRTDATGRLTVRGYQSYTTSLLLGPHQPDAFPIRLAFQDLAPLYYRFDVQDSGPVPYAVFNSEYDYNFGGQWVGDFDGTGQRTRSATEPNDAGKIYTVVAPSGGQTLLWRAKTTLRQVASKPDSSSRFTIDLILQQNGVEGGGTR